MISIYINLFFFLQFSLSSPSPSPLSSSTHQPSPSPLIRNTFGRFSFRSSKDAGATSQGLTRLEKRAGTKTKSCQTLTLKVKHNDSERGCDSWKRRLGQVQLSKGCFLFIPDVHRSSTLLEMEVKRRVCLPCTTQLDLITRQGKEASSCISLKTAFKHLFQ